MILTWIPFLSYCLVIDNTAIFGISASSTVFNTLSGIAIQAGALLALVFYWNSVEVRLLWWQLLTTGSTVQYDPLDCEADVEYDETRPSNVAAPVDMLEETLLFESCDDPKLSVCSARGVTIHSPLTFRIRTNTA
jgi:hypothetical protein